MGSRFSSTPSWTYHLWGRAWVQWILQQKHSFVWWPFFHWMPHWKEVDSLVEAQQSFEEIHVFQWCSWTTSCSWCLQPWCESLWQVQHWKTFCSLYPRKQQTEIFYWSFIEWWLVCGFQQVAMEDLHWMQSRPFHRYCETSWELSSIVHDRALLPWLGFSCDRSEVCEFYFPAWFEAIQSWYFAFHVWQWQWCWLYSKRTWYKGTSSLWFLQILHFEDNHVVERWLWFVFDFKWCCFVLWWHSLQIFWDREWVPIFWDITLQIEQLDMAYHLRSELAVGAPTWPSEKSMRNTCHQARYPSTWKMTRLLSGEFPIHLFQREEQQRGNSWAKKSLRGICGCSTTFQMTEDIQKLVMICRMDCQAH